ncbi:PTS system glucoside-specific EIICBA component [Clostridioides difficile]|nr:PTS system glucoside-specific EIICBA component [Clostridioides difficile]
MEIASPLSGKLIPLSKVNDDVFSGELLGKGMAIVPDKGNVISPVSGVVQTVLTSKHAVAIESDNGIEILIHVGLDTVFGEKIIKITE